MITVKLVDRFPVVATVQGEGSRVGALTTFVRFFGCDYHCGYADHSAKDPGPGFRCDTVQSWVHGATNNVWDVEDVIDEVRKTRQRHVVITGGNPYLQPDALARMTRNLTDTCHHVTIETQASVFAHIDVAEAQTVLMSMSPKLHQWPDPSVLKRFINWVDGFDQSLQVKIVVQGIDQLEEAIARLQEIEKMRSDGVHLTGGAAVDGYFIQPDGNGGTDLTKKCAYRLLEMNIKLPFFRLLPQCHKTAIPVI